MKLPLRLGAIACVVAVLALLGHAARAQSPSATAPLDDLPPTVGSDATPAIPGQVPIVPGARRTGPHVTATVQPLACGGSQAFGTAPVDTTPGAFPVPPAAGPAVPWNDFTVSVVDHGIEPVSTIRVLLEPAFKKLQSASEPERTLGMAAATSSYGYQLVGIEGKASATGLSAVVYVKPLPMVRHVTIDIENRSLPLSLSTALLDEEVRRRLQVKAASYLPNDPVARKCKRLEEQTRIDDYLHDEGYYEAKTKIDDPGTTDAVNLHVTVDLGPSYVVEAADVEIDHSLGALAKSDSEIRAVFRHRNCVFKIACIGLARFTRTQHQADLVALAALFHKAGYPAVRVTSDYQPAGSFDRRTHHVKFKVAVDQRRLLDVQFEGIDQDATGITTEELNAQLTFFKAGTSDDVEAGASAHALADYLQKRGHFEARVTWTRERVADAKSAGFDLLRYRIDLGPSRAVQEVDFAGVKALDPDDLRELVYTKANGFAGTLFGTNTAATSEQLANDVERIVEQYRRAGYRDARVEVTAASAPEALDNTALVAALVAANRGNGLYVKFSVDEGTPTKLARVELAIEGDPLLCEPLLGREAELIGDPHAAVRAAGSGGVPGPCAANLPNLLFKAEDLQHTGEALRDWLWNHGHSRAAVEYSWEVLGPHEVVARYKVSRTDALAVGKIVVRGNFVTHASVITGEYGELGRDLLEGKPLTAEALAKGAQRLRATGLFDSVNVLLPNLCSTPDPACVAANGEVNAIVVVQEREDYKAQVDLAAGYSSYSGVFGTVGPSQKNLFGYGIYGAASVTDGTKIFSLDGTVRIPRWLMRRVLPSDYLQGELTGFTRQQDTPNFGEVTTTGVSVGVTYAPTLRTRPTPDGGAQSFALGVHYDFRDRGRNVDTLRPIGIDSDQPQVPINTRTGSVGVTLDLDRRVDRRGALSPLGPEAGYHLGAGASFASTYLLGQDDFVKVFATGTKYWPVGTNLVVRADLRYDEGFPLFGAVLLPEVERFFAGGDSTVRGFEDDKLKTEVIQTGVPPLGNISQLRILPSGGNIRVMGSLDAQVHIFSVFYSAVFADAGMITDQWSTVTGHDIRPSLGMALFRVVTPFGTGAFEYAVPLLPQLGDDPRGRQHIWFAARAQF